PPARGGGSSRRRLTRGRLSPACRRRRRAGTWIMHAPERRGGTDDAPRPLPVSRADLDRVIRRAAELQLQEGGDDGGELTEAEVLRTGREVGLEMGHLRRALGELRAESLVLTLPPDEGPLRRLVGEGRVRVDRVVPGEAAEVEERLVRWLAGV